MKLTTIFKGFNPYIWGAVIFMISGLKSEISLACKHIFAHTCHICRRPNDVKSDVTYAQAVDPFIVQNGDLE